MAPEINPPFPQIPHFLHFPRVCVSSGPGFPGAFNSPISLCIQILVFFIPLTSAFPGPAPSAPSFSSFPSLFTSLKSPKSAVPGPAPSQCRMQRRFHGDDGILALFCEPESPESSPRTFLSGLYVLHSQWGWRRFRRFRDYFTIFCWNLRNLPAEPSSKTFSSCTAPSSAPAIPSFPSQILHFPQTPPTRRETKLIPVKKHCDLHRHFRPLWPYRKSETCCRGHSELYFVSCVLLAPAAGGAAWSIGALAAALVARPTTTTPAGDRRR